MQDVKELSRATIVNRIMPCVGSGVSSHDSEVGREVETSCQEKTQLPERFMQNVIFITSHSQIMGMI